MKLTKKRALALLCSASLALSLAACGGDTGGNPTPSPAPVPSATPQVQPTPEAPGPGYETTDVIVVGAGMGGLSAAAEAARLGAKVVLLEKLGFCGGSSTLCEGYMWSSGSKLNEQTGQGGYAPDLMEEYLMWNNHGNGNQDLIHNIIAVSGQVFDTYMEEGLRVNTEEFTFGAAYNGNMMMAFTSPDAGAGVVADMQEIALGHGVDLRFSSPATGLITDDSGAVVGVTVQSQGGDTYELYGDTVILATGGFINSPEMMKEYNPTYADNLTLVGSVGDTGDGQRWAMDLGATLVGGTMMSTYTVPYNEPVGMTLYSAHFIVNAEGERFRAEMDNNSGDITYAYAVTQQTGNQAFALFDSSFAQADLLDAAVGTYDILKADSLEDLARQAGIDYAGLQATADTYNADYAAGNDDSVWGTAHDQMGPLTQAPYYMVPVRPWCAMGTLAGIKVNENCQVLGTGDAPIPNLYGCGEFILGNIVDNRYPTCGTALASGMYGGVIAARHALAE